MPPIPHPRNTPESAPGATGPGAPVPEPLPVGRVVGAYGVAGWIRVHSDMAERGAILDFSPWLLQAGAHWEAHAVEDGREQGPRIYARLAGIADRDRALALSGRTIAVDARQLPRLAAGEYYWRDLVGLAVWTRSGVCLGRIERLFETGANDVLVVHGERERLLPYVPGQVVLRVDLAARRMEVDWDPEF